MNNPLSPITTIFPAAKIFLTEGWYSRADIQVIMDWFERGDKALAKSIEETKDEKCP